MKNEEFNKSSYLFATNTALIEELYEKYLEDPESVDSSWHAFFNDMPGDLLDKPAWYKGDPKIIGVAPEDVVKKKSSKKSSGADHFASKVKLFVGRYRSLGHMAANLDPLGLESKKTKSELKLTPEELGFSEEDMHREIGSSDKCNDFWGKMKFQDLAKIMEKTYAGNIGFEFSHIPDLSEREWLHSYAEQNYTSYNLSKDKKIAILQDLLEASGLEEYLHVKFPGAKRFSVEGGEASIMSLAKTIRYSGTLGVNEVVIGMAHRGRLNTLTKVMGKPYHALLAEFAGIRSVPEGFAGDVKYHLGYSNDITLENGHKMHLTLTPNPSHLEAVNPVNEGRVRAKQDLAGDKDRRSVLGILVHGDAAFCGQGVVFESLAMSVLDPYYVGGTIHVVINNQIGFTANPSDGRPGRYATEIAKSIYAPVIHVNGDDAEAVAFVTQLAVDYRQQFGKNIVIDIVCYRKYGHNEGDEPFFTQSVMYTEIKKKKTPARIYADRLVQSGVISDDEFKNMQQKFKDKLNIAFDESKEYKATPHHLQGHWDGLTFPEDSRKENPITGLSIKNLQELGSKLCNIPEEFPANSKIRKLLSSRLESINSKNPIDWATAEAFAFASLLEEGYPVRITGQDAGRGTFSHRHSVIHSQNNYDKYLPLNNLSDKQAMYEVADSNLSEYGVLGFEYGYSMVNPNALVIWEAQFGDFSNGCQIILDQFISSGETKWQKSSGLVMLLPHGYEGQGPEHSSARLERYLQLCAEDNIQVACPSSPASIFHLLRRQMLRSFRKPLVIMSPKSILRNKMAVSDFSEFDEGTTFQPILDDKEVNHKKIRKVVLCSGKVYYDLLSYKQENKIQDVAIVRLEQYYPFPEFEFIEAISNYKSAQEFVWCQEEPKNMGAWSFIRDYLDEMLLSSGIDKNIKYSGRKASASPAVGYLKVHNDEQLELVKRALK